MRDSSEKALQEARNAQLMREGEIATLRRTMEKVRIHAASTVLILTDFLLV